MKDKIQQILEREIAKLDQLSLIVDEPLSIRAIKSLDVLIKAYHSFCNPPPPSSVSPTPEDLSTADLLTTLDQENGPT